MARLTANRIAIVALLLLPLTLSGCAKLKARDELNKGVRSFKGGKIEEAIEHFKTSIELDPELTNAQLYLATAYASQFVPGVDSERNRKVADIAIAEFDKVLEREPANINALKNIASIHFNLKEWDKAKDVRRKLIEVDGENPEHDYTIGVIDWTLTYTERMTLRARLGISNNPEAPIRRRERERLSDDNSELVEEGIDHLQKALEINPKYLQAIAYLNLMYREKADLLDRDGREAYLVKADEMVERHKNTQEELKKAAEEGSPAS